MSEQIIMTPEELEQFRKNAKLEGENEALKKSLPFAQTSEKNEHEAGYMLRLQLAAKSNSKSVEEVAKSWAAQNPRYATAKNYEAIMKNMQASVLSTGGFMLTQNYANDFIPVLKERAILRANGAQTVPLVNGSLIYRTEGTGATGYWIGEGESITKSDLTGGQMTLTAKKLAAIVVVSNDLLRYASPELDAQIEKDLMSEFALKEDSAFLRGSGTANLPPSLKTLAYTGNVFAQTATPTAATMDADLQKAKYLLRTAQIPMVKGTWIVSPRIEYSLLKQVNSSGNYMFRDEMVSQRKILGIPYVVTSIIPDNLGAGTNESEIYLADMEQVLIGTDYDIETEFFANGSYSNGSATISGISTDESVIRAKMKTTIGLKYSKAVSIITGVTWS